MKDTVYQKMVYVLQHPLDSTERIGVLQLLEGVKRSHRSKLEIDESRRVQASVYRRDRDRRRDAIDRAEDSIAQAREHMRTGDAIKAHNRAIDRLLATSGRVQHLDRIATSHLVIQRADRYDSYEVALAPRLDATVKGSPKSYISYRQPDPEYHGSERLSSIRPSGGCDRHHETLEDIAQGGCSLVAYRPFRGYFVECRSADDIARLDASELPVKIRTKKRRTRRSKRTRGKGASKR